MTDNAKPKTKKVVRARTVDANAVRRCVEDALKAANAAAQVFLLDSHYRVLSEADMMSVVRDCHVEAMKYVSDYADCDKHSRLLYALIPFRYQINSVAMVLDWSGKHSYNLIVVNTAHPSEAAKVTKLEARWLEPQAAEEIKMHSAPYYSLTDGMILV